MPVPVTPWADFTPPTAKSLNLALYTCDGASDNPNGIAAQSYRPVLFESISHAVSFGSAVSGSVSSMSTVAGTAPTTNGLAVYDTAGYYGQTSDQPAGSTFYEFSSVINGSSGDGSSPGGWIITGHFAALKRGSSQTAVGADLIQTTGLYMSGSHQLPSSSQDSCSFFLDLVNSGLFTWQPAVSVYDSASATVLNAVNVTDSSGETCRLYVIWAGAASSSSGELIFNLPGIFNWTAPPGVIGINVQAFGAGGGGGAGNASAGGVEFGGGGAGGGEYIFNALSVTPGNNYPVNVGVAGTAGANPGGNGAAGGNSTFSADNGNVISHGGSGGTGATISASSIGGAGGNGGAGTLHFPGGGGAAGATAKYGGGGGSSAGPAVAGNTATTAAGATAPAGGGSGGTGGSTTIIVGQMVEGSNTGFGSLTVTFGTPLQAGSTLIISAYVQGSTVANPPVCTLQGNILMNAQTSGGQTVGSGGNIWQLGIFTAFNVAGGEQTLVVTGATGSNRVILCRGWEVTGLGPTPNVEETNEAGQSSSVTNWSNTVVTTGAPDLWFGTVSAQAPPRNGPFSINVNSGNGWIGGGQIDNTSNGVYGAMRPVYQTKTAAGTLTYSGTLTFPHQSETLVVALTASPDTTGASPLVAPGGGGGGGLGLFDGAQGLDGKVILDWTGQSGSGYGTPALPAPLPMWTVDSTISASLLNGNTGIKGVVDFLNNPPILRVHASASQSLVTGTNTTIALKNDSGGFPPPPPPPPTQLTITTVSLPAGFVGASYSTTITATGGTLPYSWSAGTGIPNGLSLNATTGVISGIPTVIVNGSFVVTVTDHAGATFSQPLSINIQPAQQGPVIDNTSLPPGVVGSPYSATLTAHGGALPYTWSETGAMSPLTLNPSTGVISGTPTVVVTDHITVTVTDNNGLINSVPFTIQISAGLIITTPSPQNVTVGTPFSVTLAAQGGTPGYTWSETGVMPGGLMLNGATGVISGTPTTVESVTITALVTDNLGQTANKQITFNVGPSGGGGVPSFNKIVVVVFENRGTNELIAPAMFASAVPYLNSLVSQGAYFSQSYGILHPSQANYYALFSGATQGITVDTCPPPGAPYTTSNLGGEIIAAGKGFAGYGELIPTGGPLVCTDAVYDPGHCPWLRFPSQIPISSNHDFSTFPTTTAGFAALPALTFVAPGSPPGHDMEGQVVAAVTAGDTWLRQFFDPYLTWARANNSLLIVTFDEDQGHLSGAKPLPGGPLGSPIGGGHVATIFAGANVKTGVYPEAGITASVGTPGIDHYNVCATIAAGLGIAAPGTIGSAAAKITDCWTTVSGPTAALTVTPSSGTVPFAVTADASASTAGGHAISSYSFNFGDGSAVVSGASPTAPHTYTVAGNYTASVTVTDTASFSSTASVTVAAAGTGGLPSFDHIVMVIFENHSFTQILGTSSAAPNFFAKAQAGANFTNSHAITHPSFPNYLALYSGSVQGTTNDACPPPGSPYSTPNLGADLIAAGKTFIGFAENLPASLATCSTTASGYARRHVPWVNFSNVPASASQDFTTFPTTSAGFAALPTFSMVIPNLSHDMHSNPACSTDACVIAQGNAWLPNMNAYATWAQSNNSLLIIQFDENDGSGTNQIPTIFVGAHVKVGQYSENIDHYTVLRTIEDIYGLPHNGAAASRSPITDCWQ